MQDDRAMPPSQELGCVSRQPQRPLQRNGDASGACTTTAPGYLIFGITHQGLTFRPSDWTERLAGVVALFVAERGTTTPSRTSFASPIVHEGIKSLLIDAALHDVCPDAFDFLSCFAAENNLTMSFYECDRAL